MTAEKLIANDALWRHSYLFCVPSGAYNRFAPLRSGSSYECFILRAVRFSYKHLGQGIVKERVSLRNFYGRNGDLIKQYEVPLFLNVA